MARMLSRIGVILALLLPFAPERGHAEGVAAARAIVEDLSTRALNLVSTGHIDPVRKRQGFDTLLSEHFTWPPSGGSFSVDIGEWRRRKRPLSQPLQKDVGKPTLTLRAYDGQRLRHQRRAPDTRCDREFEPSPRPRRASLSGRLALDRPQALKIIDVVIEGVSLSVTQRSEYGAYIRANGGKTPIFWSPWTANWRALGLLTGPQVT